MIFWNKFKVLSILFLIVTYPLQLIHLLLLVNKGMRVNKKYSKIPLYHDEAYRHRLFYKICKKYLMVRFIFIKTNSKKVDKPRFPFLSVANHKSNVDGIAVYCSYYKTKPSIQMTFLAKEEVKKSKIINSLLSMIDAVFVNRESARSGMNAIRSIKELLLKNKSVCVFSEGTRVKDPTTFGDFKPGSISAAVDSQRNIWPIAIKGSHKIWNGPVSIFKTVNVQFINQIDTKKLISSDKKIVTKNIQKIVWDEYNK